MPVTGLLRSVIRTFTFRKGLNYLSLWVSYVYSRTTNRIWHWGRPASISIEPTTSCNLGCPQCPSGLRQFTRPTGSLDLGLYKKIIDELGAELFHLILYFQGEPYLNPHFFHFVEYARQKKIFTSTSTNAHFLTERNARKTVDSGLDKLIISMDGTDQETYEKYRMGGDLEKVKTGIRNLMLARKDAGISTPYVELQFIVFGSNEHQVDDIKRFAEQAGVDRLVLKSAQIYDFENGHALIPTDNKQSRYKVGTDGKWVIKSKLPDRCFRMWQGCVITWDGKVVPCCFDKDASHRLGDLRHSSFKTVWRSEEYKRFRKSVFTSRKDIPICANCTEGLRT